MECSSPQQLPESKATDLMSEVKCEPITRKRKSVNDIANALIANAKKTPVNSEGRATQSPSVSSDSGPASSSNSPSSTVHDDIVESVGSNMCGPNYAPQLPYLHPFLVPFLNPNIGASIKSPTDGPALNWTPFATPFASSQVASNHALLLSQLNKVVHPATHEASAVRDKPNPEPPIKTQMPSVRFGRPPKNKISSGNQNDQSDMIYYPNIQCLLCKEWVCSRNRYMHIESHLQYKPYKCSVCGYDNRKEIFISLHIARVHENKARVLYLPDTELEQRAWKIAEECLQHTRQVLMSQTLNGSQTPRPGEGPSVENEDEGRRAGEDFGDQPNQALVPSLEKYEAVYRPKIFNSQRAEKTQIIEASRELGIFNAVPSSIKANNREVCCKLCSAYLSKAYLTTEEHARSHLSKASYKCVMSGCTSQHWSKNFMQRHMKEVHRIRRSPIDHLDTDLALRQEFFGKCQECFPDFYTSELLNRLRIKYTNYSSTNSTSELLPDTPPREIQPKRGRPKSVASLLHAGVRRSSKNALGGRQQRKSFVSASRTSPGSEAKAQSQFAKGGDEQCLGCEIGLTFDSPSSNGKTGTCINCMLTKLSQTEGSTQSESPEITDVIKVQCSFCSCTVEGNVLVVLCHSLAHLQPPPFGCSHCSFSHWNCKEIEKHSQSHGNSNAGAVVNFHEMNIKDRWLEMTTVCFGESFVANYHKSKTRSALKNHF